MKAYEVLALQSAAEVRFTSESPDDMLRLYF